MANDEKSLRGGRNNRENTFGKAVKEVIYGKPNYDNVMMRLGTLCPG